MTVLLVTTVFAHPMLTFIFETTPDPDTVTPGPVGFVAIFIVAVATVLLAIDMTRRIRRTTYRAAIKAKLEAELAAQNTDEDGRPE